MKDNQIKEAFQRVKQDINLFKQEIDFLKNGLTETQEVLIEVCEIIKKLSEKIENLPKNQVKEASTHTPQIPTFSTHTSTHPYHFKPLKHQISLISTGNQGVPTDRQTNRQTNRHIDITPKIEEKTSIEITKKQPQNSIENAAEILDSLDSIKKEIRLKFKRLTDQEFLVFSTLYQLEEEKGHADYKSLSAKLNLTESSIRDYIGRLIKKGIPVEKNKINNKNIHLFISQNLKKIATLPTILTLRDL